AEDRPGGFRVGRFDPGRPGHLPTRRPGQRWTAGNDNARAALELEAPADARGLGEHSSVECMVAPIARVPRRLSPLREVVDERGVAVVGAFRIFGGDRFGVAVIQPKNNPRAGLELWNSHPEER